MKRFILLAALALTATAAIATPAYADRGHGRDGGDWHHDGGDHVHLSIGLGFGGYYPPGYGYYGYPSYYYVAPPPVVYVPPPAYYAAPTSVYYAPPQAIYAPEPSMPADQTSPTYTDEQGRTCREYQSNAMIGGALHQTYGTACLQPDGTWRAVQ